VWFFYNTPFKLMLQRSMIAAVQYAAVQQCCNATQCCGAAWQAATMLRCNMASCHNAAVQHRDVAVQH